ncbi:hypothetical protein [Streptomyces sp. NPDC056707]|uniref:hypothetical protein n=1 Tax=Streptomyces sp. NPDC056707 TaxID=3345919 RepID=UPI003686379D
MFGDQPVSVGGPDPHRADLGILRVADLRIAHRVLGFPRQDGDLHAGRVQGHVAVVAKNLTDASGIPAKTVIRLGSKR